MSTLALLLRLAAWLAALCRGRGSPLEPSDSRNLRAVGLVCSRGWCFLGSQFLLVAVHGWISWLTALYSPTDIVKKLQAYVDDINAKIEDLDTRSPVSKYVLPDGGLKGRVEITFDEEITTGITCKLDSHGYQVLYEATKGVIGCVKPYADTGILPLVRDLQRNGDALDMMAQAISSERKNPLPMYQKPQILLSLERYDEALEQLEHIIEFAPLDRQRVCIDGQHL